MNPFLAFRRLLPGSPLQVGTVLTHTGSGDSIVQLPEGGNVTVRGDSVATLQNAYLRDGQIQGPAPNITPVEFTV